SAVVELCEPPPWPELAGEVQPCAVPDDLELGDALPFPGEAQPGARVGDLVAQPRLHAPPYHLLNVGHGARAVDRRLHPVHAVHIAAVVLDGILQREEVSVARTVQPRVVELVEEARLAHARVLRVGEKNNRGSGGFRAAARGTPGRACRGACGSCRRTRSATPSQGPSPRARWRGCGAAACSGGPSGARRRGAPHRAPGSTARCSPPGTTRGRWCRPRESCCT